MVIWELHDAMLPLLKYFPTKREAQAHAKLHCEREDVTIRAISVAPGRVGVCRAINDAIDFTCFNEG